jgi:hypothetical protein
VYPLPEKGEAGVSIDPLDSVRVYVVTELKEPGNTTKVVRVAVLAVLLAPC